MTKSSKKYIISLVDPPEVQEPAVAYTRLTPGFRAITKLSSEDINGYHSIYELGVTSNVLKDFLSISSLHLDELSSLLHVTSRTLRRLKPNEVLDSSIAERLLELIRLYKKGHSVFEDIASFNLWVRYTVKGLGDRRPIDLMTTTFGIELVKQTLGRIEHGVHF